MIRLIVMFGCGLCCTLLGEQKSWVQMAVDRACIKMYQDGDKDSIQALEDLKKSINDPTYRVECQESRNVLIKLSILDISEEIVPPLILNALKKNLNNQPFDTYIALIVEKAHQKALAGEK